MKIALVRDGVVQNITSADAGMVPMLAAQLACLAVAIDGVSPEPAIAWLYDGESFTAPAVRTVDHGTRLSRDALRKRFTAAEKVAIYTAAKTAIDVEIYLDDVANAKYIDLADLDTIAGIIALEAAGLIGAGRANIILTTLVTEDELP